MNKGNTANSNNLIINSANANTKGRPALETPQPSNLVEKGKSSHQMRLLNINTAEENKFKNNQIKTAKYNAFTFLPLATIYQFDNYFNAFFLVSAIIASIPEISFMDPGTAVSPFVFVIVVSLIREAIEDYKKTKYDLLYNNSPTQRWNKETKSFENVKWKNIQVGQILKIEKNETIPCDVLVIKSSANNGFCYFETTNLDGESALKPREAMIVTDSLIKEDSDLNNIHGKIEVDPPDNNIYKLKGTLYVENYEESYFSINNVLLRGGRLKNVDYVYGVVIYTGRDTKIMMNIKHGSNKLSSIDTKINKIVIYIIFIVLILCIICTIFGSFFRNNNLPDYVTGQLRMNYLFYYDPTKSPNNVLEVIKIFTALFIIFNTLIPISLIISYQIVKGFQVLLIDRDSELAKDPDDKVKILSMSLHEDLGTIKHIFTDKTGTLTKNEMAFKACSIFTKLFDDEEEKEESGGLIADGMQTDNQKHSEAISSSQAFNSSPTKTYPLLRGQPQLSTKKSIFAKSFDKNTIIEALTSDIPLDISDLRDCPFRSYHEAILECFLNIVTNHNVLTEIDKETGEKSYQGSNPDEVTLVTSASELGVEFLDRDLKYIRVNVLGHLEVFEIIHKFDFTSSRQRSSIIVRDSSNKIKLYIKGADSVIFAKINKFSQDFLKPKIKDHLDSFAKRGLRTLCYSFKTISEDELAAWEANYKDIIFRARVDDSLAKDVEKTISDLETDLTLLGVTALEDKLQDNVKNDLQDFLEAGINVWMITGDKLDTAETIGHSCKLFNDDTEVFKIRTGNQDEAVQRVKEILDKMKELEKEVEEMKAQGVRTNRTQNFDKRRSLPIITGSKSRRRSTANKHKHHKIAKYNRPILSNIEIDLKDQPQDMEVKEFNNLNEFIQDNKKKTRIEDLGYKKMDEQNEIDVVLNVSPEKVIFPDKVVTPERLNTEDMHIMHTEEDNAELKADEKRDSLPIHLIGSKTIQNPRRNTVHKENLMRRHRNSISEPYIKPIEGSFYSNNEKTIVMNSPQIPKRADEINDVSIMNLLMDQHFFENSADQINAGLTFLHNRKNSDNLFQNNQITPDGGNAENSQTSQTPGANGNANNKDIFKFNSNDLKNMMKRISNKENSEKEDEVNHSKSEVLNVNNSITNKYEVREITNPNQTNPPIKPKDAKIIELKTINEEDEIKPKRRLSVKVNINSDPKAQTHGPYTSKSTGKRSKPVLKPTSTPRAATSCNDFQNIMDYYQGQIEKLEKRKKSLFDFKPKRWKHHKGKETQEEEGVNSKNLHLMNFGLMVEGDSISHCLEKESSKEFWKLIKKCRSIIACRCSPIQKSEIVNYVKLKSKEITLAIGDGGNDVNMIKTANVGVGIFGKEGYQAAFNSDYAISQFKYLKRLIFYHGRYSLERNSYFIYFFFFKNVLFTIPQFWLCFFSGFGGTNYYDDWFYLGYNSFLTALPVGAKAIMDEDIDIEFKGYPNRELLKFLIPDIYKEYRDSIPFNIVKFFLVFLSAFIYSLAVYFIPFFAFKYGIQDASGRPFTFWDNSLSSFMAIIIIHFVVICEDTHLYTWFDTSIYILQFIINIVFLLIHNSRNAGQLSGIMQDIFFDWTWWFTTLLSVAVCLLPFFVMRRADYHFSSNIINNLRQRKYEYDYTKKVYKKKLEQMSKATRTIAKFKRLYKDTNPRTDNYADKRMMEMVNAYKTRKEKEDRHDEYVDGNYLPKRSQSFVMLSRKNFKLDAEDNIRNDNVPHPFDISERQSYISSLSEKKNINEVINVDANPSKFFD